MLTLQVATFIPGQRPKVTYSAKSRRKHFLWKNWSSHFKFGSCTLVSDLWAMAGNNVLQWNAPFRPNWLVTRFYLPIAEFGGPDFIVGAWLS